MTGQKENVADGVGCRHSKEGPRGAPNFSHSLNAPDPTLCPFCTENFMQITTFNFNFLWL